MVITCECIRATSLGRSSKGAEIGVGWCFIGDGVSRSSGKLGRRLVRVDRLVVEGRLADTGRTGRLVKLLGRLGRAGKLGRWLGEADGLISLVGKVRLADTGRTSRVGRWLGRRGRTGKLGRWLGRILDCVLM